MRKLQYLKILISSNLSSVVVYHEYGLLFYKQLAMWWIKVECFNYHKRQIRIEI